jgi:hypothetical protein
MLLALPIMGGAIGGLIAGGIMAAQASGNPTLRPTGGSRPSAGAAGAASGWGPLKWIFGGVLVLGAGLLLLGAVASFLNTWDIVRREPRVATAADLCRKGYAQSAPDWISYTFAESKPLGLTVTRSRLGHGGDVQALCLLVRVEDKWLVATVAPGFEGNDLVGRVLPVDTPGSQSLIERVRKKQSTQASPDDLLPYEFNAVDGCPSDQRQRCTGSAIMGFFGSAGVALGLYLLCGRRKRPVQTEDEFASTAWRYQPLPKA